jgi:hypothetical protein
MFSPFVFCLRSLLCLQGLVSRWKMIQLHGQRSDRDVVTHNVQKLQSELTKKVSQVSPGPQRMAGLTNLQGQQ